MSDYSALAKSRRMEAVRDLIDAGSGPGVLEFGTAGMAQVLVSIRLNKPCGKVDGDTLTITPPEFGAFATAAGVPVSARIRNSKSQDVYIDLPATTALKGLKNGKLEKNQAVLIEAIELKHG